MLKTGEQVVLCGDYNAVQTDLDAYRPERWVGDAVFFPETKALYRRLIGQGWADALRKMHPDGVIYTYWDYFRNAFGRDAGLRMDHLLLSPTLAPKLQAAGVDRKVRSWEKASDHAPTWIELDVPAAPLRKSRTSRERAEESAPRGLSERSKCGLLLKMAAKWAFLRSTCDIPVSAEKCPPSY